MATWINDLQRKTATDLQAWKHLSPGSKEDPFADLYPTRQIDVRAQGGKRTELNVVTDATHCVNGDEVSHDGIC